MYKFHLGKIIGVFLCVWSDVCLCARYPRARRYRPDLNRVGREVTVHGIIIFKNLKIWPEKLIKDLKFSNCYPFYIEGLYIFKKLQIRSKLYLQNSPD